MKSIPAASPRTASPHVPSGHASHSGGKTAGSGTRGSRVPTADKTIYSLQALRFIAAALVVISHIRTEYELTPFGSSGVDVFFVISGFIIYYVTREGAPQFFTRRLIRIVPLYWLGTLALAAVALKSPGSLHGLQFDMPTLFGSLFFIPVWNASFEYHLPLLLLGWSLNYEILFYLIFFVALKISFRHRLLVSSAMLVALALVHPFAAPQSALFFWSDTYIIEFIYGMVLAQVIMNTRFIEHARLPLVAAVAGFVLYCWLLLPDTGFITEQIALEKWRRILAIGLPSAALVVLVLACEQAFRRLSQPVKSATNFLGELSYPIYIFHIYVMGVLKRLGALKLSLPAYNLVVFGAALIVATLAYLLYELPVRNYLSRTLLRRGAGKGAVAVKQDLAMKQDLAVKQETVPGTPGVRDTTGAMTTQKARPARTDHTPRPVQTDHTPQPVRALQSAQPARTDQPVAPAHMPHPAPEPQTARAIQPPQTTPPARPVQPATPARMPHPAHVALAAQVIQAAQAIRTAHAIRTAQSIHAPQGLTGRAGTGRPVR